MVHHKDIFRMCTHHSISDYIRFETHHPAVMKPFIFATLLILSAESAPNFRNALGIMLESSFNHVKDDAQTTLKGLYKLFDKIMKEKQTPESLLRIE